MATSFPSGLDSFTNPTAVDTLDSPPHDTQHADANDAIEALQSKVGVDGSAVTTSLDYKVANLESRPVETKTASYVLVAADVNKRIVMNNAGATTITVNDGVFAAGDTVWIHNIGAGTTTVTAGTATVNTAGSLELAQWGGGALYFTSASTGIFFPAGGGSSTLDVEYLVIAGGGSGGSGESNGDGAGGAGAGGYRNSYASEASGGNSATETPLTVVKDVAYLVSIGAGGASPTASYSPGHQGSVSIFGQVVSIGGGWGGGGSTAGVGGSAGGKNHWSTSNTTNLSGITGQGGPGGAHSGNAGHLGGSGGGGAGGATPPTVSGNAGTAGAAGLASSITGSSVTRGGGGGGGSYSNSGPGAGGAGGGGLGGRYSNVPGVAGTANTGGGGGGGQGNFNGGWSVGGTGGSGVVILRYPNTYTITLGAGLTGSTATDGSDKVTTITAGEDTVSWS